MTTTLNKNAVKEAAAGRWPEILETLGEISPEFIHFDQKEGPCPRCGGDTRYRGLDESTGALFCSHCFNKKNGDGISALQWARGWDFKTAIHNLANYLGLKNSSAIDNKPSKSKGQKSTPCISDSLAGVTTNIIRGLNKKHDARVEFVKSWKYDAFHILRFNLPTPVGEKQRKEFRPVHQVPLGNDGRMGWSTGFPKPDIDRPLYHRAEITVAVDTSLLTIHGGEKATDDAVSLGLLATTNAGGEMAVGKTDWTPAARFAVAAITIDNDATGEKSGREIAAILKNKSPTQLVKIIRLPGLPSKGDIVEWKAAGGTREDFLRIVDETPEITSEDIAKWKEEGKAKPERRNPDLPTIIVDTDEKRVADEAVAAISIHPEIYQRGGLLVHVVRESEPPKGIARPKDSPRIAHLRLARLREIAAESADWLKESSDSEGETKVEPCHPPEWCIKAIDARGQWPGIRRLEGIVESPVLRADGSILQTPGYDVETGLLFEPQQPFPSISDRLTLDDAKLACGQLLEVVIDFPFQNYAHRACWLAGVLTPLARFAIDGPSPLFVVDANVRGCGKSLSIDATGIIVSGRVMPRMTLPRDDEEFRKRITALALSGEPLILIDNIAGGLGGPSLDAALTARSWTDRILGSTEMAANIPLAMTWYATGNNIYLQADTARRVCHIRLESPEENPEERSGFHHADLLAFVRQNRSRLATAAVTILSAYCAAGRPNMHLKPWGSFEAWSDLIRSAIVWAGQPDPGETRVELRIQNDREAMALSQLLTGWAEIDPAGRGLSVVQALKILNEFSSDYVVLRNALWELCPPKNGKDLNARSIGMKLHHLRHRVMGGRCFDRREGSNQGSQWVVIKPENYRTKDTSDTSLTPRTCAGAHTHAHENPQGAGNSVTSSSSVTKADFSGCLHRDVEETPTADGYNNRQCRLCGAWLPCQKAKEHLP